MVKRLLAGPWEQIKQRFPDRQIYHRTEGQVRYFAITTEMQLSAIGGVCLLAVWLSLTTVGMLLDGRADQRAKQQFAQIEAEYRNEVDEARAAEAAAIAYMESRTDAFDRTAGEFQMRHDTLRRLLDFADDLSVGEERESPSLDEGRILMAASPADPDPRQALLDPVGEEAFDGLAEERVAALLADQESALAEAENAAERRLENLRAVLRLTGMRVDEAMQEGPLENEDGGTGGPLISLDQAPLFSDALNLEDPFNARVARIANRLVESEQVEALLNATPLGLPIDGPFRETSRYGARIDPFTRRLAMHAGKDFAAFRNAPIVAPAPGRVVYAGWRAGYGRTVEVDHGYGFRTRYGHLHSIDVRRGDDVELGQRLGGMGSTGRSTGTHLHYEIWFRGEHIDPEDYIRAGRYVH
ncbi:MAG: M23 family peptidase [Oceanicaulis sp.]|jgi:murein DD-endopeptidase MepM/ murein hydrolase activator NlpD|uniref:M23 family metallopeptidase n=1 Tax=unclassified Oceanicaulis TaxID=2632123 RepID=UPI000066D6BD|nr:MULTISPECIES: M23 family metallopeptidase [unclassified Oceanicaulis]EAP91163.1 peptidase, M23/M37 family protein [Oceanicaulis sp. HTCC2633]MBC39216.1 M23 family peptidase [Oceanicaulis sp.]MBG37265.1 M23 family peptidase [Oceanicaulis sp.]HBU61746.1 M23 family peptidase [Oceanicaulis sp.]|tara:strand:+ start:972 stop:2210 length:1239 start_codon:yes stop_codon:yes gene_type:complete